MTAEPRTVPSPKPAIFDCDGVLADSEPSNNRDLGLVLSTYGLRLQPDELRTRFRGTAHSRLQDRAMAHWALSLPDDIANARALRPVALGGALFPFLDIPGFVLASDATALRTMAAILIAWLAAFWVP